MWPMLRILLLHIASPYQCTLLFISYKRHVWAFPAWAAGRAIRSNWPHKTRANSAAIPNAKKGAAPDLNLAKVGPGLSPALHSSKARVPARFHPGIKRQGQAGPLAAALTCQSPARIRLTLTKVKIKRSACGHHPGKNQPG